MQKFTPVRRAWASCLVMIILAVLIRWQVYDLYTTTGGLLSQFIPTRIHPVETYNWGNRIAAVLGSLGVVWLAALLYASGRREERKKARTESSRREPAYEGQAPFRATPAR